jgi:hypothetical protein
VAVKIWVSHIKGGRSAEASVWTKTGAETCITKAFTAGSAKCGIVGHGTRMHSCERTRGKRTAWKKQLSIGGISECISILTVSAGVASIEETRDSGQQPAVVSAVMNIRVP